MYKFFFINLAFEYWLLSISLLFYFIYFKIDNCNKRHNDTIWIKPYQKSPFSFWFVFEIDFVYNSRLNKKKNLFNVIINSVQFHAIPDLNTNYFVDLRIILVK